MREELKPCSRCGCEVELQHDRFSIVSIVCQCGLSMDGDESETEEIIRLWNTRKVEDALRAELARKDREIVALDTIRHSLESIVERIPNRTFGSLEAARARLAEMREGVKS